ncbi:MAG TPA: phospholipid carrier-dependent glycosyltransferase [Edaphobacter sp.]|nr:phospholipid carrier-dependent glycosyltransferase [Edaphobacter sp.]
MALFLVASVRQESQTFDESDHLFAGVEYWKRADFGRNPEHPPLVKLLAAIPLLPMGLKEPRPVPIPYFKAQDFMNASQMLYSGDADAMLMRGRLVVALSTLALALLVFFAAREMFDPLTALFALGLFVFEPVLLANGALVITDVPLACLFFASVYAFYRYLRKPSVLRLALCAGATALAIAAKHSGALIVPTLVMLALADTFFLPSQTAVDLPPQSKSLRLRQLALAFLAIALVSYLFLWAIYGFRYAARPGQLQMAPTLAAYLAGISHPLQKSLIAFCARYHLFPEAYLYGWVDILLIPGTRSTFIFGRVFPHGQWFFFPALFLIKTTLTLLILLLLLPFARIRRHRREFLFLLLPPVFYMLVSVLSMLNMGVRHILPIYPFCIILAAAAAASLTVRSMAGKVAVAALCLLTVVSSLHSFPNYLAYSNEIAGGPSRTYRITTDANADWGQGLKWTRTYLDRHPAPDCWFDYSNPTIDPAYYGIHCKPLLSGFGHLVGIKTEPIPSTITGTVLLTATDESGLLWGPDKLNPYHLFRGLTPDAKIGNIILVYHGTFDLPLLAAQTNATAALALLEQHRFPEAITLAQTAVAQAPDSAEVNDVLGQVLLRSGHPAEGKQAMATALHLAQTVYPEYQKYLADRIESSSNGS